MKDCLLINGLKSNSKYVLKLKFIDIVIFLSDVLEVSMLSHNITV